MDGSKQGNLHVGTGAALEAVALRVGWGFCVLGGVGEVAALEGEEVGADGADCWLVSWEL